MILTVTLNPSVDIRYMLPTFLLDEVNRVDNISKTAGGKGLNVSRVLKMLGEKVSATGFLGGECGEFIRKNIVKEGIINDFVPISSETRNCIAVIHEGKQTEILESGPVITERELNMFLEKFSSIIHDFRIVTVSGSLPKGMPDDFYSKIIEISNKENIPVLLDINGQLLQKNLGGKYNPILIKPNKKELEDFIGFPILKENDIYKAIRTPILNNIEWIVVTLGAEGAIVKHRDALYRVYPPKVNVINPVGSGDSVLAGFASGIRKNLEDIPLIKYGITMGVLNAMEKETGRINLHKIDWCIQNMRVDRIDGSLGR
ncbi:hexose kinase [Fervidibacillus halotolerans]|uniref:Tagatose-6-phosphate kinase n=1 Tax=Fervidibacillus halotolerans TaxID=2980027 RepID=A0A9E8M2D3_9BACI|nr:hexose kinase [Fervidibacillus halotolerans]WAA13104.1 hexose kinase [Fervidibacillus halotolerans]